MKINEISAAIVDSVVHIHRTLGPGLLESVYLRVMVHELEKKGLQVSCEVPIPFVWDGVQIDVGFRADLIVEGQVIVELKSMEQLAPVHFKQVLTYLKVTGLKVGLLVNFGAVLARKGIHRVVNGFVE